MVQALKMIYLLVMLKSSVYPLLRTDKFDIGNYVIVIYEDEYFPGIIKKFKNSRV